MRFSLFGSFRFSHFFRKWFASSPVIAPFSNFDTFCGSDCVFCRVRLKKACFHGNRPYLLERALSESPVDFREYEEFGMVTF